LQSGKEVEIMAKILAAEIRQVLSQLKNFGLSRADIASKLGYTEAAIRTWEYTGDKNRVPHMATYNQLLLILSQLKKKGAK
jgi:DNA-binding transcriptional regulator YiaG